MKLTYKNYLTGSLCISVFCAFMLSCQSRQPLPSASGWFETDTLARSLSQLTPEEVEILDNSDLITHQPVVLPTQERVVSGNDYFDWPIATSIDDHIILLFDRRHFHWGLGGEEEPLMDENSGIRMIITSSDMGKSWSEPVDVFAQAGIWKKSLFAGWGGGLGVYQGKVYLVLNEGVYVSEDKGKSWKLTCDEPDLSLLPDSIRVVENSLQAGDNRATIASATYWSSSMRITFDQEHGLTVWSTRDFKPSDRGQGDPETRNTYYGKYLCALFSKDFGRQWQVEEQKLPEGLTLTEITPLQHDGKILFFLRNGIQQVNYGQGYSSTGWFPFKFGITNIGPMDVIDTPDLIFNPVSNRYEATVTKRNYKRTGIPMEMQLWSISPDDFAANKTDWQFEGVLLKYKGAFGDSDGMNPVAGIIDKDAALHKIYIWGGQPQQKAGIFEYSRSLNTLEVSNYLKKARENQ